MQTYASFPAENSPNSSAYQPEHYQPSPQRLSKRKGGGARVSGGLRCSGCRGSSGSTSARAGGGVATSEGSHMHVVSPSGAAYLVGVGLALLFNVLVFARL